MAPSNYGERQHMNDLSRTRADHDREPWSEDEIDLLMTWNRTDDELTDMADILGRTREACRQRYYLTLHGRGVGNYFEVTETKTTTIQTRWSSDDEAEYPQEWYPR